MKIETGKYYRTRDGRKVGPILRRHFDSLPHAIGENSGCWFHDGRHQSREETPFDLVAEWADETVQAFKPGDLVRFKADAGAQRFRRLWFADMPEVLVVATIAGNGCAGFEGTGSESRQALLELAPPVVVREGATYIDVAGETVGPMRLHGVGRFIAVSGDGRGWDVDGTARTSRASRLVAEAPATTAATWYPDDSGEWVEHAGGTCPVAADTRVIWLLHHERKGRKYIDAGAVRAENLSWDEVVAYRIEPRIEAKGAQPQPAPYYLVHGAGPTNYRHASHAAALAEAHRLAAKHPGVDFYVLPAMTRVRVPVCTAEVTEFTGAMQTNAG